MGKIGRTFRFLIPVIALVALVVFLTAAGRRERARLEKNKAIVQRAVDEFWNKGDIAAVDELFATDYVNHDPAAPDRGDLEGLKQWAMAGFAAFPDLHVTIEDLIAEGDKVAKRYTTRLTWTGDYMGMPPTGKQATEHGT
jgi:predicted ester cyclase